MLVSSLSVTAFAKETAINNGEPFYEYYTDEYASQQERVNAMTAVYENDSYRMYMDTVSGEFALLNLKTNEYTFSNPYDINTSSELKDDLGRNALLSQLLIEYKDTMTGTTAYLSSFGSASAEEQISIKTISDGIRVEYALGTVESKRLIPIYIEATRFETMILATLEASVDKMTEDEKTIYNKMGTDVYYKKYDQTDPANEILVDTWRESYSCLSKNQDMIIYVFQGTERSKSQVEKLIRKFCPAYTYDELEYDHELTEYEAQEKELPLFRMAIEYKFDENGFTATVPAKSIRYNSTNYSLENIVILPYFGCTTTKSTGDITRTGGYIFIPDGSGTLLQFYNADGTANSGTQGTGVIYGQDQTKETLVEGSANAETAKFPVFGLVEEYDVLTTAQRINRPARTETVSSSRGFTAIITEGETFASIIANLREMSWANLSTTSMEYSTVYATFSTTQGDTVNMGGSLGSESSMSTTIDTKYTGNYSIKYVILEDDSRADDMGGNYYSASYVGMANAYRDHLISTGELTKLTADEIANGMPLYVETFGSIKSKSTFLTFPVTVTTPLTTFDDVETIMKYLSDNGISNQKFILTGFANGTMTKQYYPTYVKWESKVGGKSGFKSLLEYANKNGISIYPNFDFQNVAASKSSFSMSRYAAKTMSGRYASLREYDPEMQEYSSHSMAIQYNLVSAGSLEAIYSKFEKQYGKYNVGALAAQTLGYQLNSDFDVDDPITREEAKSYIEDVLASMREDNGKLLVAGGNSYVLKYATDIVDLPLDNSGYAISSYSVPFMGMVLYGYMDYAGSAINMEGDTNHAVLKSIENGAGLYFIVSYQNTDLVKSSTISDYYSLMFETWQNEMIEYYNILNNALKDVRNATITAHEFETAYRMDADVAGVFYGLYEAAEKEYEAAKKNYSETIDKMDAIIKGRPLNQAEIDEEVAATQRRLDAQTNLELLKSFVTRHNTGNVVSVTYTTDDGKAKTFYINYNSYDVVAEIDGKIFKIGAESFISNDEISVESTTVGTSTEATAWTATTKQKSTFDSAYGELLTAIADNNETLIARRIVSVNNAVNAMTSTDGVLVAKTAAGKTVIINSTKSDVIVKISDTEYVEIDSQSYIVRN